MKFKVGDKIVRNGLDPDMVYIFKNDGVICEEGEILTISQVGVDLYNVENSYIDRPNWSYMDKYFDLAPILTWKEKITGSK